MRRKIVLLGLFSLGACDNAAPPDVDFYRTTATITRGDGVDVRLGIEVANSDSERAYGLMNRPLLPEDKGMLFVFGAPAVQQFWMRDTLIPLDMIFIETGATPGTGRIMHIHAKARPHDETPVGSRFPVQWVLEVNGGVAERRGIRPGDTIKVEDLKALQ